MRAMKDSGIEWIGQIPQEWKIGRVKHIYDVTLGKMLQPAPKSDDDELCSYMCAANINWSGVDLSVEKKMWFSAKDKESYRLVAGDLLVTEGGDVAVSCIWNDELPECYIQNAIHRVRPKSDASNRYLYYWLSTLKATGYIDLVCNKATLAHFTKDKFDSCVIPVVSADEQHAIANYLDVKCAEIDALIAAKEKTNALLKERRQSIIYEAVTKGLNPDAPMKDSGIEWIGQIPENWEVIPLSKVSERMNNGYVGPTRNIFFDSGVRYLQSLHIKEGKIIFEKAPYYVSPEWAAEHALGTVHTGDVLIVQTGDIGQVACVPEEYNECNCHALIIVTPRSRFCCGEFLSYLLQSHYGRNQLLSCRTGALHPHLNSGNIGSIKLPIPSVDEQKSIVAQLNLECEEYDKAIQQNNAIIEKLKEYRQSIIYEAVTGKIEI